MKRLLIAAGGGGDAFTAGVIAESMKNDDILMASFSWDRVMYDPDPGPRNGTEFKNILKYGLYNTVITESSKLKKDESKSFLPVISRYFKRDYFLMELDNGVQYLHNQIMEIVDKEKVEEVIILDIGGDILATGNEKGLKSPIADASILSACNNLYVPVKVWVSGCGLDGELSETELQLILNTMNYSQSRLSGKLALKHLKAFEWLPSEASALFFMASAGYRGVCEIRQDGYSVELNDFSSAIFCIDFDEVYLNSKIADRINQTQSLAGIEKIVKNITSISELDIERKKKTTVQNWNESRTKEEMTEYLLELSHDKKMNGISFLTRRRICELLHIKGEMRDRFIFYLKENYPEYFIPPLWKCM